MKAKTHERDPRVDPKPGDGIVVLSKQCEVIPCWREERFARHCHLIHALLDDERRCYSLGEWREEMRHTEVLHVAD